MAAPLDIKFGPTQANISYGDNQSLVVSVESNPAPTSWTLTAINVCHGHNSSCSNLTLTSDSDHLTDDHLSVSNFTKVGKITKNCQAHVQSQIKVPNPKSKVQRKGTGTGADNIILEETTHHRHL